MASKSSVQSITPADPPQPNAQTKIILDSIDELRRAVDALSNGLIEFSGRFDRRFPSPNLQYGAHTADMIRAERFLPLVYQLMQDEIFSCVTLVNAVKAAQYEKLAEEIDEFKNNKRLGNFFARIEGRAIPNGLAIQRISLPNDKPQSWKVAVLVKL